METERWSTCEKHGNSFNLCRFYKEEGEKEQIESSVDISIEPPYLNYGVSLDFFDTIDDSGIHFYPSQLEDLKKIIRLWEEEINKTSIL